MTETTIRKVAKKKAVKKKQSIPTKQLYLNPTLDNIFTLSGKVKPNSTISLLESEATLYPGLTKQ